MKKKIKTVLWVLLAIVIVGLFVALGIYQEKNRYEFLSDHEIYDRETGAINEYSLNYDTLYYYCEDDYKAIPIERDEEFIKHIKEEYERQFNERVRKLHEK